MADGSLTIQIQTLQGALAGVAGLTGDAEARTGLAGAARLSTTGLGDRTSTLSTQFTNQASSLFQFDSASLLQQLTTFFPALKVETQLPSSATLDGFASRITQANTALSGHFIQQLEQILNTVRGIVDGVPTNRTEVVGALLQQILQVVASIEGPEAQQIEAWLQSVQTLQQQIAPLLAAAETHPNPEDLVIEFFQRSLDRVLNTFGFQGVQTLLQTLSRFFSTLLPTSLITAANTALSGSATALSQTLALATADYPTFRDAVVTTANAMQTLKAELRPILSAMHQVTESRIFQPGALEAYLREKLDAALAVQVRETQRIDDPFQALFNRIDAAIEGIDLSIVRTQVLGFFEQTRHTLEQVNLGGIGETIETQLGGVEAVVNDLQQGVTDLLQQVAEFFNGLVQRYRQLASQVGEFLPDGTFRYRFEQELRRVFDRARAAIAGDPATPNAFSLKGSLTEFQSFVEQLLSQVTTILQPVQATITDVKHAAVKGMEDFRDFLTDLNVPQLIDDLKGKVEEIVAALGPIDFGSVTDPVIEGINENTAKLRQINPSDLNNLLKEALKVALDVVIGIDFTATISTPLKEQFAAIKQIPQQAIDQLQQRYEEAIALLNQLNPEQLLAALFSAFDVVENAINSFSLNTLLQPLDALHEQYLVRPLTQLKPSVLLKPVSDSFQEFVQVFDSLNGSAAIAPLNAHLNQLKSGVDHLDLTGWIDHILTALNQVKQALREIRPSQLLQPLTAELARLDTELDRFKPSVVFQPAIELAAPLLAFLENVQQSTIHALHHMFQAPLQLLEDLQPQRLTQRLQAELDAVLSALRSLNLPSRFNQLKAQHFDLTTAVQAQGVQVKIALAASLDPERYLGELMQTYNGLLRALEGVRRNLDLGSLGELYTQLRDRLIGMLPPYARELMDPETFKRVMRLMDPTRFLQALDERFAAIKAKLLPIQPADLSAELDETYETVLNLVDGLTFEQQFNQIKGMIDRIKNIVAGIRIDFITADLNRGIADVKAFVNGLNPARIFAELDTLHQEIVAVVDGVKPSALLAGLNPLLDQVKGILMSINPRVILGSPLLEIWETIQEILDAIDFRIVLAPLVDQLDELEVAFEASLRRTEDAFDQMLGAARTALSGRGATVSGGISI